VPYKDAAKQRKYQHDYQARWYKNNLPSRRKQGRDWHAKHRRDDYFSALLRLLGFSKEAYEAMWLKQGGRCAICGIEFSALSRRPSVDHNHKTRTVRALLCGSCNRGLGYFKESTHALRNAAVYIEAHSKKGI
jgi:hypothetical protein